MAEGELLDPGAEVAGQLDRRLEVRAFDLGIRRADDLVERQLLERPVRGGEVDAAPGAEIGRKRLGRVQQIVLVGRTRRRRAGRGRIDTGLIRRQAHREDDSQWKAAVVLEAKRRLDASDFGKGVGEPSAGVGAGDVALRIGP
ncbi:MAG: hypothetical protein ABIT71_07385, partial [Vicinamibacteraceae bacterium]